MITASIYKRLLLGIASVQLVGATTATYLVLRHERSQSYRVLEANLSEKVAVVRSLVETPEEAKDRLTVHHEFLVLPNGDQFAVWDDKAILVDHSPNWPMMRSPEKNGQFMDVIIQGAKYRLLFVRYMLFAEADTGREVPLPVNIGYAVRTSDVEEHLAHVRNAALLSCGLLFVSSLAITSWVVKRGLRPLSDLAEAAEHININRWHFEDQEHADSPELKPLVDALQRLLVRLKSGFERERRFFNDAAHELKSSVSIVRSTLDVALQGDRTATEYRQELRTAMSDTERLQTLVQRMLQLARIEAADIASTARDSSISELNSQVLQIIDRMGSVASRKEIELTGILTPDDCWVHIGEEELTLILVNLVENAITHSEPQKTICLKVASEDSYGAMEVRDQGHGISASALAHVFDRFYREDLSRSRATGGAGLGLSITKALVTNAGGTIAAQSELGVGSSFRFKLPRVRDPINGISADA